MGQGILRETKPFYNKWIRSVILILSIIPILLRLAGAKYAKKDIFDLLKALGAILLSLYMKKFQSFKEQISRRKTFSIIWIRTRKWRKLTLKIPLNFKNIQ